MIEKVKIFIRYWLWRFGWRTSLPAYIINRIPVAECHEELVNLRDDTSFFFSAVLAERQVVYLRKSVYHKLIKAQTLLPKGYHFKIYSACRSHEEQLALWQQKYALAREINPQMKEEDLVRLVRVFCADPRKSFGNHETGAAVDIALCNDDGTDFDMGTTYQQISSKAFTASDEITLEQRKNRNILCDALKFQGFINYPNEWWHFCYGDRMWAAYGKRKTCFYGYIEP